jgi:tryptophan synthase alpha chain
VRGLIVPDLTPDADEGLYSCSAAAGLAAVPVVSPTMREERLRRVAGLGCEYLYATLRSGTTGSLTRIDAGSLSFLERIRGLAGARQPKILGGFGVANRQQVEALEPHVHAVVVGSTIVRAIAGSEDPRRAVREKVRQLLDDARGSDASVRVPSC